MSVAQGPLSPVARRGRVLIIVCIILMFALEGVSAVPVPRRDQWTFLAYVQLVVRLALTLLLAYYLLRGSAAARWLAVSLLSVGALLGAYGAVTQVSAGHVAFVQLPLAFSTMCIVAAVPLAWSPSVRVYFAERRAHTAAPATSL